MNAIRSLLFSATITLIGISACNYTVGECWPVGQGGGSTGDSVTAGGGVILPTGPTGGGGYGDTPPKEPQGADPKPEIKCNSDDEDESETRCRGGGDATADTYLVCNDPCPENDAQCMSGVISYFKPSNFKFVTIVADDGSDLAGGWQEANSSLIFGHNIGIMVICPVRIGMPLRAEVMGKISPSLAASYSAEVANAAAGKLWPTDLPQGIFCANLKTEIATQFKEKYKALGAKVN